MDNLKGKTVSLAHGAGGKQTSELIDQVFKAHFANPELTSDDAAVLKWKDCIYHRWIYCFSFRISGRKYRKAQHLRYSK